MPSNRVEGQAGSYVWERAIGRCMTTRKSSLHNEEDEAKTILNYNITKVTFLNFFEAFDN